MRGSFLKRALGLGVAVAAAASYTLTALPSAHAASDIIAAAGSDTTQGVMGAILGVDGPAQSTTVFNINAGNFQSSPLAVTADAHCNAFTYHNKSTGGAWPASNSPGQASGELAAPDGSGEGRSALNASVSGSTPYGGSPVVSPQPVSGSGSQPGGNPNGCIDIARSSGARRASDPATNEYYAFAVDGVTWGSTSLNAPSVLTQSQVQAIYNCAVTDWSQVGGNPGPIQRLLPQTGSGTLSFFLTNVLGVSSINNLPPSGPNCPSIEQIQENQYYDLYHGSSVYGPAGDATQYPNAIGPFSAGKWSFEAGKSTNPTVDLRAGFRPGALTVQSGTNTVNDYAVSWSGSQWTLNTNDVVGSATPAPRSENLNTTTSCTGTPSPCPANVVQLVATTTPVPNVTTTTGSRVLTAAAGTFNQNAVNSPITGANFPNSTVTSATADGSSVTISNNATASGSITVTLSSHFNAGDAGAALSGNGNIPGGTTINFVLDATHAQLSTGATAGGTGVATTITPVGQVHQVTGVTSVAGNSTITAAAGTFNASDVNKTIQEPNLFPGTLITAVAGDGSSATVSPAAHLGGTASASIGFTVISQGNVAATVAASAPFPGARFVFNVIDSTSPSYTVARSLVGYQDQVGGAKSLLCNNAHNSSDTLIVDNGFVPLLPQTSAGGNVGVTCFKL